MREGDHPLLSACPECARIPSAFRSGPFAVHAKTEPSPVPGWMIVAPVRHVEQIDALEAAELVALGPLVAQVAAALRAETPCEKVYVNVYAEVLHHLHVHVIARPPDLPAEHRGPKIFLAPATIDPAALEKRILSRLS